MHDKKEYIIVKDRHPGFSEVLNDCKFNLCVPAAKGESLGSVLQKICAKISSSPLVFVDSDTIEFVRTGNTITANYIGTGGGSGNGSVTSVAAVGPASGFTVTGSPITTSGTFTFALNNDLLAVENLNSTGIVRRTATNTWSAGGTVTVPEGGTGLTALGSPFTVLRVNAGGTGLEYAAPAVPTTPNLQQVTDVGFVTTRPLESTRYNLVRGGALLLTPPADGLLMGKYVIGNAYFMSYTGVASPSTPFAHGMSFNAATYDFVSGATGAGEGSFRASAIKYTLRTVPKNNNTDKLLGWKSGNTSPDNDISYIDLDSSLTMTNGTLSVSPNVGANIYNSNGTILSPRTVNMDSKSVIWSNAGLFRISDPSGSTTGTYDFNLGIDFLTYTATNSVQINSNTITGARLVANDLLNSKTTLISANVGEIVLENPTSTGTFFKIANYSGASNGDVLSLLDKTTGRIGWAAPSGGGGGGGGSVTSFSAGSLSPLFTTNVATSTTTPNLTFTLNNASANTWFGNGTGSAGVPSYNISGSLTKTDDSNVTITLGGTPTNALLKGISLTMGWTGVLPITRGGTALSALGTANQQLRVNAGATALEYFTPAAPTIPTLQQVTTAGNIATNPATLGTYLQINGGFGSAYSGDALILEKRFFGTKQATIRSQDSGGNNTPILIQGSDIAIQGTSLSSTAIFAYGAQDKLVGYVTAAGSDQNKIGIITIGSGLTLSGGTLSGNIGSLTNFTAGNFAPFFTTNVANPTTAPALTFTPSNVGGYTFMGNDVSASAPIGTKIARALTKTDDSNITLTITGVSGGDPTYALMQAVNIAVGWTGLLPDARIASSSSWNNKVDSVTGTTNRITVTGLLTPVVDIAATYVGQTSITTLGTVTTGTWTATKINPIYGGVPVGGASGQVLTKNSGADNDLSWTTVTGGSGGIGRSISSTSSPVTMGSAVNTDYVIFVTGTTTITLPSAASNTNMYTVIRRDASLITTVVPNGAQTIDGAASLTLNTQYESVSFVSDGSNWNTV